MQHNLNTYNPDDGLPAPSGANVVFISHRSGDKPAARSLALLLSELGLHYWLDEEDEDLQRAAMLGMTGDAALVHAIERGIRHSTSLLGLLSPRTVGSWWVPYEIGFARAQSKGASFVALDIRDGSNAVPEYARISSVYASIDELARWASSMAGRDLHSDLTCLSPMVLAELSRYLPSTPRDPSLLELCATAIGAASLLARRDVQRELALRSSRFAWIPETSPAIKDLAYALLAPLAASRLGLVAEPVQRALLSLSCLAVTSHYALASEVPPLKYAPEVAGWRQCRYVTPAATWMQGLTEAQLNERLERFLFTRTHAGSVRLATRAEFAAEFDRVLRTDESSQRGLGVLINPLFGFSPEQRPVYWRILAVQCVLYANLIGTNPPSVFDRETLGVAHRFIHSRGPGVLVRG
jgi:hypothetical protein